MPEVAKTETDRICNHCGAPGADEVDDHDGCYYHGKCRTYASHIKAEREVHPDLEIYK